MADTTHLILPLLAAAQAQKHVTHNDALLRLDALVQLSVKDRDLTAPPGAPADGDRYIPASGATGAWAGWDLNIAWFIDGVWTKLVPREGWRAWVDDEDLLLVWDGAAWADALDATGAIVDGDFAAAEGFMRKTGAGAYEAMKSNLAATVAPGATDDSAAGYAVGSRWVDVTADKEYVCVDATADAAVWVETTAGAGGGESNTASNVGTAGVGLFKQKTGVDLEFKKLNAGSAAITVTDDVANNEVDVDIADGGVTLAKMANMATDSFLGRDTAGAGSPEVLSPAAARAILNVADGANAYVHPDHSGDVTSTGDGATVIGALKVVTGMLAAGAVTFAKIATAAIATAAQFRANTASLLLQTDEVWSAAGLVALTDAASIAWDMSTGINFSVTLGGNRTLDNQTNAKVGQTGVIIVAQDATGSRTLAYGTNYKFAGGTAPVLTTTASAKDTLFYFVESATRVLVSAQKDWK